MTRPRRVLLPSLGLALTVASGAAAQPAASKPKTVREQLPEDARRQWDRGNELFDADNFPGAAALYLKAYDLSKNPRVLYNVAVCEKSQRHYSRAAARFRQELAEGAGKLSAREVDETNADIASLERFVSTLELSASPPGASVLIDGDPSGTVPDAGTLKVDIDVGPHEVRLFKEGFVDQARPVTVVSRDPVQLTMKLEPAVRKGLVTVTVQGAPHATVAIDNVDVGAAPFHGEVAEGPHTFSASAPGYLSVQQRKEVVSGGSPLELALNLSGERHEGRVHVEASEPGAVIEIDGEVRGTTSWEGTLHSGPHQLNVRKTGFDVFSQNLDVADDQDRTVRAPLVSEHNQRWVWWAVGGTAAVVVGVAVVSYFVFKAPDPNYTPGNFPPGVAMTRWRF